MTSSRKFDPTNLEIIIEYISTDDVDNYKSIMEDVDLYEFPYYQLMLYIVKYDAVNICIFFIETIMKGDKYGYDYEFDTENDNFINFVTYINNLINNMKITDMIILVDYFAVCHLNHEFIMQALINLNVDPSIIYTYILEKACHISDEYDDDNGDDITKVCEIMRNIYEPYSHLFTEHIISDRLAKISSFLYCVDYIEIFYPDIDLDSLKLCKDPYIWATWPTLIKLINLEMSNITESSVSQCNGINEPVVINIFKRILFERYNHIMINTEIDIIFDNILELTNYNSDYIWTIISWTVSAKLTRLFDKYIKLVDDTSPLAHHKIISYIINYNWNYLSEYFAGHKFIVNDFNQIILEINSDDFKNCNVKYEYDWATYELIDMDTFDINWLSEHFITSIHNNEVYHNYRSILDTLMTKLQQPMSFVNNILELYDTGFRNNDITDNVLIYIFDNYLDKLGDIDPANAICNLRYITSILIKWLITNKYNLIIDGWMDRLIETMNISVLMYLDELFDTAEWMQTYYDYVNQHPYCPGIIDTVKSYMESKPKYYVNKLIDE